MDGKMTYLCDRLIINNCTNMRRWKILMVVATTLCGCTNGIGSDVDFQEDKIEVVLNFMPNATTRSSTSPADYFNKLNVQLFNETGDKVFSTIKTQTKDDPDFGRMSVQLAPGSYTVVAVGHSSIKSATIKSPQMVQFTASDGEKLTDTFCHCSTIDIQEDGSTDELRMNRVAAMFVVRSTDVDVPESFAKLLIEYTGGSANFNPTTSQGTTKSSQSELRDAATEYQCYTFPYMSNTCKLQVTLTALTTDGAIIRKSTLSDVPVTRNQITTYTGPIFEEGDGEIIQRDFGFTVNGEWEGSENYTF